MMEDYNDTLGYNQNPYTESYFVENEDVDELPYINHICKKQHLKYHIIPYKNSLRSYKRNRTKYVEEINKWLDCPLQDTNGAIYRTNTMLNYDEFNILNENETNIEENDNKDDKDDIIMRNIDVVENLYNNILYELEKKNYKIKDLNQFKEDLIHYVYILSDIDN